MKKSKKINVPMDGKDQKQHLKDLLEKPQDYTTLSDTISEMKTSEIEKLIKEALEEAKESNKPKWLAHKRILMDCIDSLERVFSFTKSMGPDNVKDYRRLESLLDEKEQDLIYGNLLRVFEEATYEAQFRLMEHIKEIRDEEI